MPLFFCADPETCHRNRRGLTFPLLCGYLEGCRRTRHEEALRKMPSESKQARETQKRRYQGAIESRRNLLVERGVEKDRIPKDPHLKHLRAKLRKTSKRLAALAALEKQKEDMALRKQQKLEAKTEEPADSPEQGEKKKRRRRRKRRSKTKQAAPPLHSRPEQISVVSQQYVISSPSLLISSPSSSPPFLWSSSGSLSLSSLLSSLSSSSAGRRLPD